LGAFGARVKYRPATPPSARSTASPISSATRVPFETPLLAFFAGPEMTVSVDVGWTVGVSVTTGAVVVRLGVGVGVGLFVVGVGVGVGLFVVGVGVGLGLLVVGFGDGVGDVVCVGVGDFVGGVVTTGGGDAPRTFT
jgi:hypothetical protein